GLALFQQLDDVVGRREEGGGLGFHVASVGGGLPAPAQAIQRWWSVKRHRSAPSASRERVAPKRPLMTRVPISKKAKRAAGMSSVARGSKGAREPMRSSVTVADFFSTATSLRKEPRIAAAMRAAACGLVSV